MEITSPEDGIVEKLLVEAGEEIHVGQIVMLLKTTSDVLSSSSPSTSTTTSVFCIEDEFF